MERRALKVASTLVAVWAGSAAAQLDMPLGKSGQTILPSKSIPQFVQALPKLSLQAPTPAQRGVAPWSIDVQAPGGAELTVNMCEFDAQVLPPGTPLALGATGTTRVWGYRTDACPRPSAFLDTYLGPVIVAERGTPTAIRFVNRLGSTATTGVLAYKYGTDQTLHWADPLRLGCAMKVEMSIADGMPLPFGDPCALNYGEGQAGGAPIVAVPHLHGGEVPPEIDGSPDSWFSSDPTGPLGDKYYSMRSGPNNEAVYRYPNVQEAAPIWFHDHTLGATRLNVYAGLAGAYFVVDPNLALPANLPGIAEAIPLVIQGRTFDTNGQLFFQSDTNGGVNWAPSPFHPYWSPEVAGDTIVVNGKAWPYLDVEPRRYRFVVVNGSNARTFELSLVNLVTKAKGPPLWVIGTDGGYLDAPVRVDPDAQKPLPTSLVVMPGERYELIVDFGGLAPGTTLLMRNTARTPYPFGAPPNGATDGRVMLFRVGCPAGGCPTDASYDPASGVALRTGAQAINRLVTPGTGTLAPGVTPSVVRQLTLNEVMWMMPMTVASPATGDPTAYPGGPLEVLVNNTKWSGKSHMAPARADFTAITVGDETTWFSELPVEGATEVWEIVNMTADAHPIHLHLVQFQVLNRQRFQTRKYDALYQSLFPAAAWDPRCPGAIFCPGYGPPLDYTTNVAWNGTTTPNPARLVNGATVPVVGGNPDVSPYLQGPARPPETFEAGWKDTVSAPPGTVTRVVVRWAPTSLGVDAPASALHFDFDPNAGGLFNYVWHCHIIDHEDNEMMRPDSVQLNPAAPPPALRDVVRGQDY